MRAGRAPRATNGSGGKREIVLDTVRGPAQGAGGSKPSDPSRLPPRPARGPGVPDALSFPPPRVARGLTRRGGPPAVAALLLAPLLSVTTAGPLAAAPFQDDYEDYEEEEPGPVTVDATAEGPAAVPLGNLVGLNVDVSGGEGDPWIQMEVEYGAATCRAVVEQDGAWRSDMHDFLVTVTRAGGHDATITAGDEASPTSTDDDTLTVTGLPPDAVSLDCGDPTMAVPGWANGNHVYQWLEEVRFHFTAGGEDLGDLYTHDIASPQERIRYRNIRADGTWAPRQPAGPRDQIPWVPPQGTLRTTFRWDEGNSWLEDMKGAPDYGQAEYDTFMQWPAGEELYQQEQRVRISFMEGCDQEQFESDWVTITAVLGGTVPGPNDGTVDFVDTTP